MGRLGVVAAIVATVSVARAALPDLVPEAYDVRIEQGGDVNPGDVVEGCAGGTTGRTLLRFSMRTRNAGAGDLLLGDPGCPDCKLFPGAACANPLFVCAPAHGHAHFGSFSKAELVGPEGVVTAIGRKVGFCVLDLECGAPKYTCSYQGLSAGCADVYLAELPCQYIDLTGADLPPGAYRLRVTVDPDGWIAESDETNNTIEVPLPLDCVTARDLLPACTPNPFLCYGTSVHGSPERKLTPPPVIDTAGTLGALSLAVTRPRALCMPASAGTDGRMDATTHLRTYAARPGSHDVAFTPSAGLRIVTQLGETSLDVIRPDGYAAPAAADPQAEPRPLVGAAHTVDHFACFRVRVARAARHAVRATKLPVDDGLDDSSASLVVKKPRRLCTPVATSAGPMRTPTRHLLCYDVAQAARPRARTALVRDDLTARAVDLGRPRELCLLAEKNPPRPLTEDLEPCTGRVDVWRFDGRAGERVDVRVDTADAATASDLCAELACGGLHDTGDDEAPCTFAPAANGCPRMTGVPASDASCVVTVRACGSCAAPERTRYVLRAAVAGEEAHPTLVTDDAPLAP